MAVSWDDVRAMPKQNARPVDFPDSADRGTVEWRNSTCMCPFVISAQSIPPEDNALLCDEVFDVITPISRHRECRWRFQPYDSYCLWPSFLWALRRDRWSRARLYGVCAFLLRTDCSAPYGVCPEGRKESCCCRDRLAVLLEVSANRMGQSNSDRTVRSRWMLSHVGT